MFQHTIHNQWGRLLLGVAGSFLYAFAVNIFVVPMGLYTGGLLGVCQLLRTLIYQQMGIVNGYDFSGILYFLANVPIFIFAYRTLGKNFFISSLTCTATSTLFLSLIPALPAPVVEDILSNCLVGGILTGVGCGFMLTCGCSSGGLDIVGLCLAKRGSHFTIGRFNIIFNALLYSLCGLLFSVPTMIYSIIYTVFTSVMLDKVHQQSINVQVLIFTKDKQAELADYITHDLSRGVTYWTGEGGYTHQPVKVLCTCLSKFEINELRDVILKIDPHAFITTQEGVKVMGYFPKRLG